MRVSTGSDVNGSLNRGGLQYFYDSSLGYGTSGPDNNGNVLFANTYILTDDPNVWAITRQRYDYDALNRLKWVKEYFISNSQAESQQSLQTYDYDRWGNRTINAGQTWGTGINNTAFEVETARNRLYSPGDLALQPPSDDQRRIRYDKAGNQIKDTYTGYGTATFDGDNRIVAIQDKFVGSSTYTYNANAQRIRRKINSQETWQIYGIDGELVAEYVANAGLGSPQKEYGYRDGQLLITAASMSPPSGLTAHWRFDENSGTTAADASGNSNTGTLSSGATWTTGQSGAATNLDGIDDYVQVGAQSSLVMTNACTLSAWIFPTGAGSLATYGGIIINKEGEYELARFADGTIQWAFANTNPGWNWISTGYVAPLHQWTHVAVTYDSGVVKTYINGTLTHTHSGSGPIGDIDGSQNDFRVGGRQLASHNFQGRIDEVRVYNRALSASEVTALPNGSGSSSSSAQISWLIPDHLGTPRIILDQTGAAANVKRHDYLPFGEELSAGTGGRTTAMGYIAGDNVRQQFTSKERDIETNLDYFGARYYASMQGRFTGADPLMASGRASLPQSWNRYSYVLNNPLNMIDPTGLEDEDPQDLKKKKDSQPKPTETPFPKVTVTTSRDPRATDGTEPRANVPLQGGNYATGVMAPLTITITDQSGNPLQGLTVTETNRLIEAEPALEFRENPTTVTTDANGSFTDIVFGNGKVTSNKVSPQEATQIVQNQIESRVKVVTEQTLTISAPNRGTIATAVYQRTITNLDEKGNRRPAFDSSGRRHVNNFSINVTPVTVSRPKSP